MMPLMDARLSDEAIHELIGTRLRRERLDRNLTTVEVAERAGIAERTVRAVEEGRPFTTTTLLSMLRAYGLLSRIEALFPEPGPSPIQLAERQGEPRRRASRRGTTEQSGWEW